MKLIKIDELPEVGVSHNEEIKKKVILDKGAIPGLMTFGQATFKPGQGTDDHKHDTMFEVFFIQEGACIFEIKGKRYEISKDQCVLIEPGENHSQRNESGQNVTWLYFGIAID